MSFLKGFKYAFSGIIHCIKNERNMRFHTVAALYVLCFARFFGFSRNEYIILFLTIGGVIAAEVFNTAIEELCDKVSEEYDIKIKYAKDSAAGAVLVLAIFAAVIGIILFWNIDGWSSMYNFYITHPVNLCALIVTVIASLIYIIIGPVGIQRFLSGNNKNDNKKNREKGKND